MKDKLVVNASESKEKILEEIIRAYNEENK